MKTKVKVLRYSEVAKLPTYKHKHPVKPSKALWALVRILSKKDLKETNFTYQEIGMDKLDKKEPCIILMNHSSFLDLKMVSNIFKNRRFNIVSTDDGFVGKEWLMRHLGCIPTKKYLTDPMLVRDMKYATTKLKDSILMYPEASYTLDGAQTTIPYHFSKFLKMFKLPVVFVKSSGSFLRDPLYNDLQLRNVNSSAKVEYLFSKEDIENKSLEEIQSIIETKFTYDQFKEQLDSNTLIKEPFRADNLNRVIYRCPKCKTRGRMVGKGTILKCESCNESFEMLENGQLSNTKVSHIPSIFNEERNEVRKEIEDGKYKTEFDCRIMVLKDFNFLYDIGTGHFTHTINGFDLVSDDKELEYHQLPTLTYTTNADFYWYEIGDMVAIGNDKERYCCFPINEKDIVAKVKLAQEEIYKILKNINK